MKNDTGILPFRQSDSITDPLTELAREGARRMLAEALKAEADAFVASFADERLEDGRQRIVRHGFGPDAHKGYRERGWQLCSDRPENFHFSRRA